MEKKVDLSKATLLFKNCMKCCRMFSKDKEVCPDCKISLSPVYDIDRDNKFDK
jgi:uncharacterized OB-fold protein